MNLGEKADHIAVEGNFLVEFVNGFWIGYCTKCGAKGGSNTPDKDTLDIWMDAHDQFCGKRASD